jgi:hypothetical protein
VATQDYSSPPGDSSSTQQSTAHSRKNRRRLWFTLAVIGTLLLAGTAFGTYLYLNRPTPEQTAQTYCSAVQKGDYQTAYNQLSNSAKSQISESQFKDQNSIVEGDLLRDPNGAFSLIGDASSLGDHGTITQCFWKTNHKVSNIDVGFTLLFSDGFSVLEIHEIVNEGGAWRITR